MEKQFVKWMPIVVTLVMALAFFFAIMGNTDYLKHLSPKFGASLVVLPYMWYSSNRYRFCYWHKAFIACIAFVVLIININSDFYKIPYLEYCWIILLILCISIPISAILYFSYGCFKI